MVNCAGMEVPCGDCTTPTCFTAPALATPPFYSPCIFHTNRNQNRLNFPFEPRSIRANDCFVCSCTWPGALYCHVLTLHLALPCCSSKKEVRHADYPHKSRSYHSSGPCPTAGPPDAEIGRASGREP